MMMLLLGGAALILYVVGRFTVGAVPAGMDRPVPRVLVALVPVFAISIIAVVMKRPILAMHLPIACAAAAMSFGLAAVLTGRPALPGAVPNRSWALLVPAVAMLLIAALGGKLDFAVIIALLAYGWLAISTWQADPLEIALPESETAVTPASPQLAAAIWFVGLAAACVAGVLAMHGTDHLDAVRTRSSDSLVAVFLLSPAIVVPFFFELLPPCRSIGWRGSVSSLMIFTMACLCFVLPIVATFVAAAPRILPMVAVLYAAPDTQPAKLPAQPADTSILAALPSLPAIAARADLLVLVGVSLLLIPVAAGWIKPGKLEALALLVCYLMNLLLVMAASV